MERSLTALLFCLDILCLDGLLFAELSEWLD